MVRRPVQRSARRWCGFVLIDAVVASVVLGLALVAILALSAQALSSQASGEQLAAAARLADEQLNLVVAVGAEAFPSVFDTEGLCEAPFEAYSYEVRLGSAPVGEAAPASVTIRWLSGGRAREFTVETRVAPRLGDDPDPERKPGEVLGRESR